MRAVVIGANWGLVHVYALRQAGVEVVALGGRDRSQLANVATLHGIAHIVDSAAEIRALAPDLVTLATPAASHADWLRELADIPVICEKPLFGLQASAAALEGLGSQLWVNYAFAFLDTAQALLALRPRLGVIHRVELHCHYELPLQFSPAQWWLEVASHPLSFLVHLCGEPRWLPGESHRLGDQILCRLGATQADLSCHLRPGLSGIRQLIRLHTDAGLVELQGGFVWGQSWRYEPLRLNGEALTAGEWCAEDCWTRANMRSIAAMVGQFRGDTSVRGGLSLGLFNAAKAFPIDALIQQAWRD